MPRRDGTGPMGMGSRTGRGMGSCNIISPQNQKVSFYFSYYLIYLFIKSKMYNIHK
mgnify:CR=1 FL=1